jgi:ABC-type multidrug transport system ATPase subunit
MKPIIEVDQLVKQYPQLRAVDDLSFSVYKGDIYGFLGQNGAGKSTTIRMMLSLIRPTSGQIRFFGESLSNNRSSILSRVGAVIEKPDLYKYLTAYQNLELFLKMSRVQKRPGALMETLELVGLQNRAHSKVKTFSQGMKQRLGIATALVHDPEIIILDEPTNGLDPHGIADMRNLIKRLSSELGKTVLISSHLLSEIELIANRMVIIDQGKKIVEGNVSELLDPTKTVVYVATGNNLLALEKLKHSPWQQVHMADNGNLQINIDKVSIPQLIAYLTAAEIEIYSVNPRHSLEDYFLKLTKN